MDAFIFGEFRVWGSEFRVWGSSHFREFRVWGSEFRIWGSDASLGISSRCRL